MVVDACGVGKTIEVKFKEDSANMFIYSQGCQEEVVRVVEGEGIVQIEKME